TFAMSIVLFLYKEDFYEKRSWTPCSPRKPSLCRSPRMGERKYTWTIVFGDRPGFLDSAGLETGRAQPHGIWSDIECPSASGRIEEPLAIVRHIRDQVKYRLRRTSYVSNQPQVFSEHGAYIFGRAIFDSFHYWCC